MKITGIWLGLCISFSVSSIAQAQAPIGGPGGRVCVNTHCVKATVVGAGTTTRWWALDTGAPVCAGPTVMTSQEWDMNADGEVDRVAFYFFDQREFAYGGEYHFDGNFDGCVDWKATMIDIDGDGSFDPAPSPETVWTNVGAIFFWPLCKPLPNAAAPSVCPPY